MTEGRIADTGRQRLAALFATVKAENRSALLPYLTAGIPTPEQSVELFVAMAEAGADGFEVGIPYADPLMDGPVIMRAGENALRNGVTVDVALNVAKEVVERTAKPVLMMTYVNPVLRVGIDGFFEKVASTGASGVIIADLPVDEAAPYLQAAERTQLGMALFAAPTTDAERLASVIDAAPSFVYAVAEVGVTGERSSNSKNTGALASRIRGLSDVPIVFGVGISTPEHAAHAAQDGDGVIVGTAIVRRVLEAQSHDEAKESLAQAVADLAVAVRRRTR
jgi:tryptophan synthase alpha chain